MTTVTYPYDEQTQSWTSTSSYPNTKLKPERTKSWEVGLDARILNDISLNLTYYRSNTYNQTFYADLSLSSGYSNIPIQSGKVWKCHWVITSSGKISLSIRTIH